MRQQRHRDLLRVWLDDERGATAIEYALVAGLIGIAIIAAVIGLGQGVLAHFNAVRDFFPA